MRIKLDVRKWIMIGFLFICIFFPGDPYGIKFIFLFPLLASGIGVFLKSIQNNKYIYIFIMGVLYPIIIMMWSSIVGGKIIASVSEAYPPVLLLLVIIIVEYDIPYEKIFVLLLKIMVILLLVIVILDLIGIIDVNQSSFFRNAFYNYDMGLMGKSPEYAAFYKVFFKASPLLLVLIPYCYEKNEFLMAVLTLVACIFSGTRANIFCAVIIFLFGLINIWSDNKKKKNIRIIIGIILIAVILLLIPTLIDFLQKMMTAKGSVASDAVRSGQFYSFKNIFSNPANLIFGMGFGSTFFDLGRMAYSAASEIAYFDLLRKIGLIWFIPFIIFVIKPFTWRIQVHYKVAYAGYLLSCFTNPLLFSSTAYVLYILFYTKYYSNLKYDKDNYDNTRYTRLSEFNML